MEELILGNYFNQSVDNLPRGLKKIIIPNTKIGYFDQLLNNLPDNIEYIEIHNKEYSDSIDKFPEKLKYIKISSKSYFKFKDKKIPNVCFDLI